MLRIVLLAALVCLAHTKVAPTANDITLVYDTKGRIEGEGYYSESHHVTTSDGYILEINRIPYGRNQNGSDSNPRRPVVFLMHGMQNSAVAYIVLGPEFSIAYNLADAGFDVWIGNARGVLNSRNHVYLNPDDDDQKLEFFDFSFEEIAIIDVPTMIDYILETTGREQLHYIGHSQGGTSFLILNSLRPEYNEKFKSVHLLAAVGYQHNFPSDFIESIAQRTDIIYNYLSWRGYVEIFGPSPLSELEASCAQDPASVSCTVLSLASFWQQLYNTLDIAAGCATKQFAHFGQNIRDNVFRRFDYGTVGNLLRYRRLEPPTYDLNLITADVTMHYTVGDILLDERDVLAMANVMPNTRARRLTRDSFSHTDFVLSNDVKTLVTDYIIQEIKDNYKICEPVEQ